MPTRSLPQQQPLKPRGRNIKPDAANHAQDGSRKHEGRKPRKSQRGQRPTAHNRTNRSAPTEGCGHVDASFCPAPDRNAARAASHAAGHPAQRKLDLQRTPVTMNSRPRRRNVRQKSSFLTQLPGEVRNTIYQYVIPTARVLICATKPNVEVAQAKKLWENEGKQIPKPRCRLYCVLDREQLKHGLEMSIALLLVSKQISQEALHFLYSRTTFCFPNLKATFKFFENTSRCGIANIRKVELETHCYGEPYLTRNRTFKVRYERKWDNTCRLLGNSLPSLTHLKLYTRCSDWPFGKIEQTSWYKAVVHITERQKLDHVKIALVYPWFSNMKLDRLQTQLENQMTKPEGQRKMKDEEAKRQSSPSPPRATKCLRIMVNNVK